MEDSLKPASDINSPSIKDLFFRYVRFLPLFIISVALALLVAYLYLRYTTPIYRSAAILSIQQAEEGQGDEKFQQLFSSSNTKNIQSEIEYLRSRRLMERVVKALQLNVTYYGVGNIREQNIYRSNPVALQILQLADSAASFTFNIEFNDNRQFRINEGPTLYALGQEFKNGYGVFKLVATAPDALSQQYRITWQPAGAVASGFIKDLVVAPKAAGTGLLTLLLETTNPYLGADVLNQLMQEYGEATVEDRNITTNQTLAFINDRLAKISQELDSVTGRLLAYQQSNNLIDVESQSSTYFGGAEATDKQIAEQRVQLEITENVTAYLANRKNNFSTTPSTLGLNDPTLNHPDCGVQRAATGAEGADRRRCAAHQHKGAATGRAA
jgi:tyrosine-protein kinase Etk/Wzc